MDARKKSEDKEFVKARNLAYRLLSYRQRSTREIEERLRKKKFNSEIIKKIIEYLSELNYLNDEEFAKFWIQSRIQSKPIGRSLLRYQLRQKGIDEELLNKALSNFADQYDEYEAAKNLAVSRSRSYKNLNPGKLRRRLYHYLRRRGFSQEIILQVISQM